MSRYCFFDSFKEVLKKLYQVHLSRNMTIPIERFVLNIMDEVPLPDQGTNMVTYDEDINFYRPIDQYPPYATVSFSAPIYSQITIEFIKLAPHFNLIVAITLRIN